jgi:anthranilate phosphoribosyltransferase
MRPLKHAALRRKLGVRDFSIFWVMTNPAGAPNILMGVFRKPSSASRTRVLQRLGAATYHIVYGRDNMDEVSLGAATMVGELING